MAADLLIDLTAASSAAVLGTFPMAADLLIDVTAASSAAVLGTFPMAADLLIDLTAKLLAVRGIAPPICEISIVLLADVRRSLLMPARFIWTVSTTDVRGKDSFPLPAQSLWF